MTALHQAAQKAVEALNHAAECVDPSELIWDEVVAAISALESALQQQDRIAGPEASLEDVMDAVADRHVSALQEVPEPVAVWQSCATHDVGGTKWIDCSEKNARAAEQYGFPCRVLYTAPPALQEVPREPVARYLCNKCGYIGPVQLDHQRPNGSGECGYIAVRVRELPASPSTTQQQEAPRCGSYECKASQQDGVICADGECDIAAGQRAAAPSTPAREEADVQKAQDPYGY